MGEPGKWDMLRWVEDGTRELELGSIGEHYGANEPRKAKRQAQARRASG